MTVSAAARGIRLQADDDVAITTADVAAGTPVDVGGGLVTVRQDVSRGHKLAVRDLEAGAPVHRYGQVIGFTRGPVAAGEHVHLHNLEYREFERAYEFAADGVSEAGRRAGRGGPGHVRRLRAGRRLGRHPELPRHHDHGQLLGHRGPADRQPDALLRHPGRLRERGRRRRADPRPGLRDGPERRRHRGAAPGDARLPDPPELRRLPDPRPGLRGQPGQGAHQRRRAAFRPAGVYGDHPGDRRYEEDGGGRDGAAHRHARPWPTRPGGWRCRRAGSCSGPTVGGRTPTRG